MDCFLQQSRNNVILAQVTEKRKCEIEFVVPARYKAYTKIKRQQGQ